MIVRTYKKNTDIEIGVELTANHQGYFEFRICQHNLAKTTETEECFDRHLLRKADAEPGNSTSGYRYIIFSILFSQIQVTMNSFSGRVIPTSTVEFLSFDTPNSLGDFTLQKPQAFDSLSIQVFNSISRTF